MTATLSTRKFLLRAAIQSTEGVEQTPATDGSSDIIVSVSGNPITPNVQQIETNEATSALDRSPTIAGGMKVDLNFSAYMRGSKYTGGLPGTLPDFDVLLQACGFVSSVTKTDIALTATGGASGNTITDSGSGLAALTAGTVFYLSGSTKGNNGEYYVVTSAAGSLSVKNIDGTTPAFTSESTASYTFRRGVAGTAATSPFSTQSGTLAAPYAATAEMYRGMPALFTGNPSTPRVATINDYTVGRVFTTADIFGSALSASTIVSVFPNVTYTLQSSGIPLLTLHYYEDGRKFRIQDARGTVSFSFPTAGAPVANFKLTGIFVAQEDAVLPTLTPATMTPPVFRGGAFLVGGATAAPKSVSLDTGNTVITPEDPNAPEGFGTAFISARRLTGSIDPTATLSATRNTMSDFRLGTPRNLSWRLGSVPGNRIAINLPTAKYTGLSYQDDQYVRREQLAYQVIGVDSSVGSIVFY